VHAGHHEFVFGDANRAVLRSVVIDERGREIPVGRRNIFAIDEIVEVATDERFHFLYREHTRLSL
jgi:hypothetical protein